MWRPFRVALAALASGEHDDFRTDTDEHGSGSRCQPLEFCHPDEGGIRRTLEPVKGSDRGSISSWHPSMSGRSLLRRDDSSRWLWPNFGGLSCTRVTR
jgi:hypothetical protein